jgi:hypothetical protein
MKVRQDANGTIHAEFTEGEHAYISLALEFLLGKFRENAMLLSVTAGLEETEEKFTEQEIIMLDLFNELNDL